MRIPKSISVFFISLLALALSSQWNLTHSARPFFEYKGDYRGEINEAKEEFKGKYGYELMDLDQGWKTEEIKRMDQAFSQLPPSFYGLKGLKGFYRISYIQKPPEGVNPEEVPAGTFPTFTKIYRHRGDSYNVYVAEDFFRIEFYDPLFFESDEDFINIVQHEMGHAFDVSRGFPSFSNPWLTLTKFRILNMPALDAKKDSDFIYALVDHPAVSNYAPVSHRNLPTYSRQNPQEDFANSVAAYIHYPYFAYSHPARYRFLKEKVFEGKEYFQVESGSRSFQEKILADFETAATKKDWDSVSKLITEIARGNYPELESTIVVRLKRIIETEPSADVNVKLGLTSCFLSDPEALELRRNLLRSGHATTETFLKNPRCLRISRDVFEGSLAKQGMMNLYFFREEGKNYIQFIDSFRPVARARGFETTYKWYIKPERGSQGLIAQGQAGESGNQGSVNIALKTNDGTPLELPYGKSLLLDLITTRFHPQTFKTLTSTATQIRFVIPEGFEYGGPASPQIKIVYPLNLLFLEKNGLFPSN